MNDEEFLDRLRIEARALRYEPSDIAVARVSARVRARISAQAQPGVSQLLARWLRPLGVSLAVLALCASLSIAWIGRTSDPALDSFLSSANGLEIQLDGETYSVID